MTARKLLGICPHCGEPVYEDQDPHFEAEREAEGREDAIHAECAGDAADEIIDEMRRRLRGPAE